ncbi:hypothetical protein [Sporosarcina koreensis]|uniref:hypothetical protein n=1 Tax=Sporosarcina koreensis TaxID=334735 RepID=UPI00058C8F1D|nr:hypothetical protein [Sporosarcina koreensis]
MKTFLRIQLLSPLYAVMVFLPIEMVTNLTRLSRLTGWSLNLTMMVSAIVAVLSVLILSVVIARMTKRWLNHRKASYWSVLFWLPYVILFTFLFAELFPITSPADKGGPGDGLVILGMLFLYPLYVCC